MDDNAGQQKAQDTIKELVERFEKHLSSYKGQGYNEAQLRQEFINPFFEALDGMSTIKVVLPKL